MLLKNQMPKLINRKREVGVMVVDIVVEEEVGVGLEDTPANSMVIKTKLDKISTSRTEEEAGVEVEVVVVEVIHSSETKIKNKTKIVIFQVLKLWKKKEWRIITGDVVILGVKEVEVIEVKEVNSEEAEVKEENSGGTEVTGVIEANSEVVEEVEEHSISMKPTSSQRWQEK